MKNRKIWNFMLILLPLVAAVLNALPNALVMHFMADPAVGGTHEVYISGYDMLAVGYAIWGPMAAGISAILLVVLGVIRWVRSSEKLANWMLGIAIFGLAMELTLLIFNNMTAISAVIAVLLAAESLLIFSIKKQETPETEE